RGALLRQRGLLVDRARATDAALAAIDAALLLIDDEQEVHVSVEDIFEGHDQSKYEDEVRERWGDTEAYKESVRRSAQYSEEDLRRAKAASDAIEEDAAR